MEIKIGNSEFGKVIILDEKERKIHYYDFRGADGADWYVRPYHNHEGR